jgi:hypothetical protein
MIKRWAMFWTIKVQFLANSSGFHLINYPVDVGGDLMVDKAAKNGLPTPMPGLIHQFIYMLWICDASGFLVSLYTEIVF